MDPTPAPTPAPTTSLADLVRGADAGDETSARRLFESLYDELHRLAERQLRRNPGSVTLSPTTLLHETYLAVSGRDGSAFPDRARFFGYAARAMRGLIIDYVRARGARKRGGGFEITRMGMDDPADPAPELDRLHEVAESLDRLAAVDPRLAELVDLHVFAGFSLVEIAGFRGVSDRTVQRDWRKARMLLGQLLD